MKDVVGGGYVSRSLFRGFAAKPRASLGMEGDLVVAGFYPRAVSLLWRETRGEDFLAIPFDG